MDTTLLEHLCRFIGETVTVFTTSGGVSGCGFTGVLLFVNPCFIRLVNDFGTPPANPLSETICGDLSNGDHKHHNHNGFDVGSVCDIPVDKIASFCHNAV